MAITALSRAAVDADELAQDIESGKSKNETRAQMAKLEDLNALLQMLGPDATRDLLSEQEAQAILAQWERLQAYHAGR